MEEQLAALLASEEKILASVRGRLEQIHGQHIFFPALQAAPVEPTISKTLQDDSAIENEGNVHELRPLLGRLVQACEEQYLFTKGIRCPLCGRQQSSGSECGQCGSPLDGQVLKKSIRVRRVALGFDASGPTADELRPGGRRWKSVRIFDLLKAIGEKGFTRREWRAGAVVRNSRTEYCLKWDGAWYLLRTDGMKMLETGSHHELVKGLWKLWKKGGAYAAMQ